MGKAGSFKPNAQTPNIICGTGSSTSIVPTTFSKKRKTRRPGGRKNQERKLRRLQELESSLLTENSNNESVTVLTGKTRSGAVMCDADASNPITQTTNIKSGATGSSTSTVTTSNIISRATGSSTTIVTTTNIVSETTRSSTSIVETPNIISDKTTSSISTLPTPNIISGAIGNYTDIVANPNTISRTSSSTSIVSTAFSKKRKTRRPGGRKNQERKLRRLQELESSLPTESSNNESVAVLTGKTRSGAVMCDAVASNSITQTTNIKSGATRSSTSTVTTSNIISRATGISTSIVPTPNIVSKATRSSTSILTTPNITSEATKSSTSIMPNSNITSEGTRSSTSTVLTPNIISEATGSSTTIVATANIVSETTRSSISIVETPNIIPDETRSSISTLSIPKIISGAIGNYTDIVATPNTISGTSSSTSIVPTAFSKKRKTRRPGGRKNQERKLRRLRELESSLPTKNNDSLAVLTGETRLGAVMGDIDSSNRITQTTNIISGTTRSSTSIVPTAIIYEEGGLPQQIVQGKREL